MSITGPNLRRKRHSRNPRERRKRRPHALEERERRPQALEKRKPYLLFLVYVIFPFMYLVVILNLVGLGFVLFPFISIL